MMTFIFFIESWGKKYIIVSLDNIYLQNWKTFPKRNSNQVKGKTNIKIFPFILRMINGITRSPNPWLKLFHFLFLYYFSPSLHFSNFILLFYFFFHPIPFYVFSSFLYLASFFPLQFSLCSSQYLAHKICSNSCF